MSPDGSGIVVWSGPNGNDGYSVFAREFEADGALGPKLTLSAPDPEAAFASAYAPAVRYDGQGTATVVWMETTYGSESCFNEEGGSEPGEGEECEVDEYVLARQMSGVGSPFALRQLQHRHAVYPDEGSFGGSSPAYVTYGQPALAGGPADTLTVVWSEGAFGNGCAAYGYSTSYADSECEAQGNIKWTRLDADAAPLGSPQNAYTNETSGYGSGQPLFSLRVGAAADGTATVLFGARETAAEEGCWGGESTVGFLRIGSDGAATAPSELDSGCGTVRPDLALDPGGTATAVWGWAGTYLADEALLARIDPGGTAEEPHSLLDTTEGAHVSGLDVARGGAGTALAVWSEEGQIRSRRIPTSGSLAPTATVATPAPGREFLAPRLAVAPDDSAAVVWEAGSDSFATAYSLRAVDLAPDGTPGQPRTLMAANRWNHGVRVSPGAGGTFLASWRISVPQHNRVQAAWFGAGAVQGNDDFEDASQLDAELPDFAAGSTVGATNQPQEPDHAGAGGDASVWYSWTPSESGPVTVATCADDGFDPALGVYTGATLTALIEVAAASDGAPAPCAEGDSGVRFDAVAGTTYRVAVDGEGDSEGSFGLKLVSRLSAPVNDAFAGAKVISGSLPRQLSGNNIDGSREPAEPEHGGEIGGASVWYSWTASRSAPASISVCGRDLSQPLLGVYTGATLAGLSVVGTQAGPISGCSGGASVSFDAVSGTTYRVAVDGRGGREGRFSLRFDQQPANDDLEEAQTISSFLPNYASGATFAATKQLQEPEHAGDPGGHSVWYSWTPSSSGTAFISACLFAGKDSPALLAVYTGAAFEDLSQVAADSGGGSTSGCYSRYSEVSFPFVAGTRYLIAVDGKGGTEASFSLNLEQLPGNDDIEDAQVIGPSFPLSVSGSNRHASKVPGEPEHAGDPGGHSVWYSWTPSESGTAILSACLFAGKNQSALLAVYSGPNEDLSAVASDAGGGPSSGCYSRYSEVSFSFVAGTRYLIALDGPGGVQASFSMNLESRPANDDLDHAQTISGSSPPTVFGNSRHATKQPQEPEHAGDPGGHSVWYSWTPGESGIAVLSACAWSGSPLLAAYTGSDFTDLTEVASASGEEGGGGSCFGSTAEIEFDAVAGTRYLIAVDDEAGAGMWSFNLEVDLELAPANDDFAAPTQISSNSSWFYGSNRHATKQVGEPNHGGEPGSASVWFSWTPTQSGAYAIATCSYGSLDPLLGVYTGSAFGSLDVVASDDDGGNCSDGDAEVRFAAVAGTTYRIAVDGKSASTGDFELRFVTPPGNDALAAATELSGSAPLWSYGSNWLATKESQEPEHGGDPGGASVWYSWTPSESSTIQLTVCSDGALDPLLGIYTGSSPVALLPVTSEDAGEDPECYGDSARVEFDAQAGTAYRIAVDGRDGSYGDFSLALRSTPANDNFSDAAPLNAELPQGIYGDNRLASRETEEPEHAGEVGNASVWYSWTPEASGPVVLSTCSYGALDPLLAVYTGSSLATLEEVVANDDAEDAECSDDDAEVRFESIAETTYWIAVDAKDENGGQFELKLRAAGPVNDDFSDAIDIAQAPARLPGTTIGAGTQGGEPGSPHQSVWYRMQADHNGTVRLHTCSDVGAPMDLDVFTGSSLMTLSPVAVKPALTSAACGFAPGTSLFADTPALGFEAVAGTVYWISVDRYQQISPVFELRPPDAFSLVVNAPANDLRAAAERIPRMGASLARTNVGATHEAGEEEHAGEPGEGSVWFRWFASADGPVSVDTCGSEADTLLSVFGATGGGSPGGSAEEQYSDDPPTPGGGGSAEEQYSDDPPAPPAPAPGGELASSDDSELCGPGSTQSSVELDAHEGLTYLIAVDGKEGDVGPIQFNLAFDTPDTTPPETHAFLPQAINSHVLSITAFRDEPESSFECAVDGTPFTQCAGAGEEEYLSIQVPNLAEGDHTIALREVDAVGNADPTPVEGEVLVDTVAPQTSFAAGPEGPTRSLGPFELDADEPTIAFECSLDDAPASYCTSPYFAPSWLADGTHTLKVTAVDRASNRDPSPATRTFELDRTAPTATIESGPQGTVEESHVSFELAADEPATFECWLDDHYRGDCESPASFTGLSDAEHRFAARPTDAVGNVGELVEQVFRVEARPPETTIPQGPNSPVASTTAKFQFVGDEELSGFECALDAAAFAACDQTYQLTELADGMHTLEVRAVDLAGKRDLTPARHQWIVDTTPPQTTISSGPSGLTRHRGSFDFDANEPVARFECAVDNGAFSICFSGYELPPVPDGPHTLEVRAVDLAGNVDPVGAARNLTLDTVPPEVEITVPPPPLTQSSVTIEFEVGEVGASTECRVDNHSSFPCTSPAEIEGMPDGPHTISVTATDQAGNVGTATTEEFTVDEQPPDTWITGAPALYTSERSPSIYFGGSEDAAEYRCSVDGGAFAACESPLELEDLAEGEHVVRVYAIDSVGHPDPTPDEVSFTVDTVPPDTTITDAPSGPVHALLVPFSFASSEPLGGFECAMDGGSFKSCAGIKHDGRLGEHLFEVRALDRAGNADQSPAGHSFTFINQAPQASLSLDRTEGAAPLDVSAAVGGSDGDGDELSYEVQFGDGESASGKLPHGQVTHTYEEPGVYVVRLAVDDGFEHAVATEAVTVGPPEPLDARAGDDRTAAVGDPVSFDARASRPLRGIGAYEWTFGDGATATGATPTHAYDEPGTYEARLTISRGEEESTDTATITVVPAAADQSTITIRGEGAPLEGAEVLVMPANGSKLQALTDSVGRVRLRGLADGSYKFAAYKDGFLPAYGDLTVSGGSGVGELDLQSGETAAATIDSHEMTLEEIEAAGIDPNDPANQHVYEFEVHLNIKPPGQPPISRIVGGKINRDGFIGPGCVLTSTTDCLVGGGGGGGGWAGYISTTWVPGLDAPLLSALVIPFRATFLKEFYDVSMVVSNLASPGFDLRNGKASIELPSGMSLAPTAKSQSLGVEMPDIPGGGSAQTHWILRGDTEGEYDLAAHYGATLEPFGRSIKLDARTSEPIKVWGGSALKLEVDVDDEVRDTYPYTVFVKLKNVADVPVYNPAVELLKEGRVGYIEQPRQQRSFGVRELLPGHTHVAGPFIIVPEPSGEIDLAHSFIRKTAGDVSLDGTIVTHERVPSFEETPEVEVRGYGDKLVLDWEPVAGANGYQVFRTFDRQVDFPENPLSADFFDPTDPTRAVVRGIDPDEHAYYGISSLLDSQAMVHPLTFGTGEMNREWPKLSIDAGQRCGSRDMAVDLRFEALDFALSSYEMTLNDLPFGTSQPLSGYSDSATVHVPFATGEEDTDFEITVRDVEGTERTGHANLACDYVALGDSYSSGEGVPTDGTVTDPGDFLGPTPKNPNDSDQNGCHRSRIAYPRLVKANGQRAVVGDRLLFHACSGAVLDDMWADGKEMRQINRVDEGAELVTLSIGGNDMHFADIIEACVSNQITLDPTCRNDHKTELEDGYQEVQEKLPQLLRQIRQRAPGARILVVAYPQIFPSFPYDPLDLLGGGLLFSCNTFGLDNVNPWDILWLSDMQKRAAEMIEEAVRSSGSGAEYVSMGSRFNGHDVCQEFDPWFNGPFLPPNVVYSFHPNAQGQEAMADAVLQRLGQPRPESFFQIHPGEFIDRAVNVVGGGGGRTAKAIFSQYWPGSDVELTLESPSGRVIGRDTDAEDVEHELGPTFETYVVEDPEEGEWKMRFEGVDVATGGEKVTYEAVTATEDNLPPVAQFSQSLDGVRPGLPVSFDASGSSDADGEIVDYEWNFDDGQDANGQAVQHSFAGPGRYEVRLLVRDEDGASAVFAQREIWVRNTPTAVDDRYEVAPSAELEVAAAVGLLANDTVDRAGGEPQLEVTGGVAHGTLDLVADGSFHYRPDPGFTGTDTLSYELSDAGGFVSAPATVRIDVRGASVDPKTPEPGPGTPPPGGGAPPASDPPVSAPAPKPKVLKCKKGFKKKKVRGKLKCVKAKKKRGKKKR